MYVDGELLTTLKGDRIVQEFLVILEDYVARTYPAAARASAAPAIAVPAVGALTRRQRDVTELALPTRSSSPATSRSSSMIGASKPTSRSRS